MPLVDLSGNEIPSEGAPSMERGAAWLAELLELGPDTAAEAFVGMTHADRETLLNDIQALMMFLREFWAHYHSYHLANPAPPSENN